MAARNQGRYDEPRQNDYFLDGEGISREVIQADICRYLGNDALVRPTTHQGRHGYIITAYRNLTSNMITDLKADSARWEQDVSRRTQQGYARGSYNPGLSASQSPNNVSGTYSSSTIHDNGRQDVGASPVYTSAPPPQPREAYSQPPQQHGSVAGNPGYPAGYQQNPNYGQNTSPYPQQTQSPYGPSSQNQPPIPTPDTQYGYTHHPGSGYPSYPEGRPRYAPRGDEYEQHEYTPVTSGMPYTTSAGMSYPTTTAPMSMDIDPRYQQDVYQDRGGQPRDPHRRGR
ncbi:hypothetical protein FQN54_005461 [Arachnomyces sp. PD_36]|nr:hypothetical protein FQN54_005461 [Arachnomyces sp. PD_36]